MAWNVTTPDTYSDKTAVRPGAAADEAAPNTIDKYDNHTADISCFARYGAALHDVSVYSRC